MATAPLSGSGISTASKPNQQALTLFGLEGAAATSPETTPLTACGSAESRSRSQEGTRVPRCKAAAKEAAVGCLTLTRKREAAARWGPVKRPRVRTFNKTAADPTQQQAGRTTRRKTTAVLPHRTKRSSPKATLVYKPSVPNVLPIMPALSISQAVHRVVLPHSTGNGVFLPRAGAPASPAQPGTEPDMPRGQLGQNDNGHPTPHHRRPGVLRELTSNAAHKANVIDGRVMKEDEESTTAAGPERLPEGSASCLGAALLHALQQKAPTAGRQHATARPRSRAKENSPLQHVGLTQGLQQKAAQGHVPTGPAASPCSRPRCPSGSRSPLRALKVQDKGLTAPSSPVSSTPQVQRPTTAPQLGKTCGVVTSNEWEPSIQVIAVSTPVSASGNTDSLSEKITYSRADLLAVKDDSTVQQLPGELSLEQLPAEIRKDARNAFIRPGYERTLRPRRSGPLHLHEFNHGPLASPMLTRQNSLNPPCTPASPLQGPTDPAAALEFLRRGAYQAPQPVLDIQQVMEALSAARLCKPINLSRGSGTYGGGQVGPMSRPPEATPLMQALSRHASQQCVQLQQDGLPAKVEESMASYQCAEAHQCGQDSSAPGSVAEWLTHMLTPVSQHSTAAPVAARVTNVLASLNDATLAELRTDKQHPLLVLAAAAGMLEVVKVLLSNGWDPDQVCPNSKASALEAAAAIGSSTIVTTLLDAHACIESVPGARHQRRITPVMRAAGQGHLHVVQQLQSAGANLEALYMGHTALSFAVAQGHLHVAAYLMQEGATTWAPQDPRRYPALQLAAWAGHTHTVQLLLDEGKPALHEGSTAHLATQGVLVKGIMSPRSKLLRRCMAAAATQGHLVMLETLASVAPINRKSIILQLPVWQGEEGTNKSPCEAAVIADQLPALVYLMDTLQARPNLNHLLALAEATPSPRTGTFLRDRLCSVMMAGSPLPMLRGSYPHGVPDFIIRGKGRPNPHAEVLSRNAVRDIGAQVSTFAQQLAAVDQPADATKGVVLVGNGHSATQAATPTTSSSQQTERGSIGSHHSNTTAAGANLSLAESFCQGSAGPTVSAASNTCASVFSEKVQSIRAAARVRPSTPVVAQAGQADSNVQMFPHSPQKSSSAVSQPHTDAASGGHVQRDATEVSNASGMKPYKQLHSGAPAAVQPSVHVDSHGDEGNTEVMIVGDVVIQERLCSKHTHVFMPDRVVPTLHSRAQQGSGNSDTRDHQGSIQAAVSAEPSASMQKGCNGQSRAKFHLSPHASLFIPAPHNCRPSRASSAAQQAPAPPPSPRAQSQAQEALVPDMVLQAAADAVPAGCAVSTAAAVAQDAVLPHSSNCCTQLAASMQPVCCHTASNGGPQDSSKQTGVKQGFGSGESDNAALPARNGQQEASMQATGEKPDTAVKLNDLVRPLPPQLPPVRTHLGAQERSCQQRAPPPPAPRGHLPPPRPPYNVPKKPLLRAPSSGSASPHGACWRVGAAWGPAGGARSTSVPPKLIDSQGAQGTGSLASPAEVFNVAKNYDTLMKEVTADPCFINATDSKGMSAVGLACRKGDGHVLINLIRCGAKCCEIDSRMLMWLTSTAPALLPTALEQGACLTTKDAAGAVPIVTARMTDARTYHLMLDACCNVQHAHDLFVEFARLGNFRAVTDMASRMDIDVNKPSSSGHIALLEAVKGGHDAVVDKLLMLKDIDLEVTYGQGAAPMRGVDAGLTPIVLAAQSFAAFPAKQSHIIRVLLEHGASTNATDAQGTTALDYVLVSYPAAKDSPQHAYHLSLTCLLAFQLLHALSEDATQLKASSRYMTLLSAIQGVRAHGGAVNPWAMALAQELAGATMAQALVQFAVTATMYGATHMLGKLLQGVGLLGAGREVQAARLLHAAARHEARGCCMLLLSEGWDPNVFDADGLTPLGAALQPSVQYSQVSSPKTILARSVLELLTAAGADVDAREPAQGRTMLSAAAHSGNLDLVSSLLDAGASVTLLDRKGHSAITYALRGWAQAKQAAERVQHAQQLLQQLLSAPGAEGVLKEQDSEGLTLLEYAVRHELWPAVLLLLHHGASARTENMGRSVLHTVLLHDTITSTVQEELVEALLSAGADVNAKDQLAKGCTPLCYAATGKLVEALSKAGGQVEAEDDEGLRPLHWACIHAREPAIRALLNLGARKDVTDYQGWKPYDYAKEAGVRAACLLLLQP